MDIDSTPLPPPQEYSDCPSLYQSETSMNFDYLQGLNDSASTQQRQSADSAMDASSSSSAHYPNSPRRFGGIGSGAEAAAGRYTQSATQSYGHVDDSRVLDRPINISERFVSAVDELDARVEKFRKDALGLQEKRDFLYMSMDLIKTNDLMQSMSESEREEITCYIQRVKSRLCTVELSVRTVRDTSQEDSLSQINALIDLMITIGDPVMARQRCQQYLNSCCSSAETANISSTFSETHYVGIDVDAGPVDKRFESALLGCTLDDQKTIKKRLQALLRYLNKQTVRN